MKEGKWALKSTISYTWIIQHGVQLQTEPACTTCCWAISDSVGFLLVPCWGCARPLKAFPVLPPSTEIHEGSSCNLTYYSSGISRDACSLVHLQGIMKLRMLSDLQCCMPRVRCVPAAETGVGAAGMGPSRVVAIAGGHRYMDPAFWHLVFLRPAWGTAFVAGLAWFDSPMADSMHQTGSEHFSTERFCRVPPCLLPTMAPAEMARPGLLWREG